MTANHGDGNAIATFSNQENVSGLGMCPLPHAKGTGRENIHGMVRMSTDDKNEQQDINAGNMARLIEIMAALRTPGTGCPWDLEQDFNSIAPYTIEEAYEVADAIARGDLADLRDELGDLLFQVVYHARMAQEAQHFDFADVVSCICDKMVRRHPHVFGDHGAATASDVNVLWDEIKAAEKADKPAGESADKTTHKCASLLDDVPLGLPALTRAVKLQKRAAKIGFDWPALGPVFDKLEEEMGELSEAVSVGSQDQIEDEFGDVLFALGNLARHLDLDPEAALRRANGKFTTRFQHMERTSAGTRADAGADAGAGADEASPLAGLSPEELDRLWRAAKKNTPADPAQ